MLSLSSLLILLLHFCCDIATSGGLFQGLVTDAPYVPRGSAKLETGNEHDFMVFMIVGDFVAAVSMVPIDTE
jgi:hypothetical protein